MKQFARSLELQPSQDQCGSDCLQMHVGLDSPFSFPFSSTRFLSWYFSYQIFFFSSKEYFWLIEQSQLAQMCRSHYTRVYHMEIKLQIKNMSSTVILDFSGQQHLYYSKYGDLILNQAHVTGLLSVASSLLLQAFRIYPV